MELVLYTKPSPITMGMVGDMTSPYPFVQRVGDLVQAARAGDDSGIGVGESANLSVTLANPKRRVAALIGRPVRVRADVMADDGSLFFAGVITDVDYGSTVELQLEA